MLTIKAMVRVGPWILEHVVYDVDWSKCERCGTNIKWIWTCTVDADSCELAALNGQRTWHIGSECGPNLMHVSDEKWGKSIGPVRSRIRLALRTQRVLNAGVELEDVRELLSERFSKLVEGTLPRYLQRHLGRVVASQGKRAGLWK